MGKKTAGVPKQPKPPRRVRVMVDDANADFQGKVNVQKAVRANAPQSPKFSPAIKTSLDAWSASTDAALTTYTTIINMQATLEQLHATLGAQALKMSHDRAGYLAAIEPVCTNASDATSLGVHSMPARKHVEPGPPTPRAITTDTAGTMRIRWLRQAGAGSYIAQKSLVDPPTEASFTACYQGKSPFFDVVGRPGEKVSIRVASVGTTPSAWCTVLTIVLR